MEIYTGGSQLEGQVEEVSSSGAVIEMQEFSDSDDNPYEVPMPPPLTVMASVNPTDFVSDSTTNNDQSSSPHEEQQEGAEEGNDQTLPKTVEGEIDITPPQGLLPPLSRSYIREKSHHF